MRTITAKKLDEILKKHEKWHLDGKDGKKADLCEANLREANLREANLRGADLCEADLCGADLYEADLRGADLNGADLCGANLCGANLCGADLRGADLYEADLRGADLNGADLCGANLRGAVNLFVPLSCPEKGVIIGFKKASEYIVELMIPDDAFRSSATGRKCRCSKATVMSITNLDGTEAEVTEVASNYNSSFIYRLGKTVEEPNYDTCRWNECAPGIHFFITRQEAVNYR